MHKHLSTLTFLFILSSNNIYANRILRFYFLKQFARQTFTTQNQERFIHRALPKIEVSKTEIKNKCKSLRETEFNNKLLDELLSMLGNSLEKNEKDVIKIMILEEKLAKAIKEKSIKDNLLVMLSYASILGGVYTYQYQLNLEKAIEANNDYYENI